jgi:hypothetical protein
MKDDQRAAFAAARHLDCDAADFDGRRSVGRERRHRQAFPIVIPTLVFYYVKYILLFES